MDIKINEKEGKFKFRVCGLLFSNGKYLAVKMDKNKFFCLPGGHVEIGETTDEAVLREMKEELGFEVKIARMVCVAQNIFKNIEGKTVHEIGYYYIVKPKHIKDVNTNDYTRIENDKGQMKKLVFKWFTLEELEKIDFRPKEIVGHFESRKFVNLFIK